ncbi:efflux RND transporter periplasmic adaptor subunit [Caballeronia telluris]|uniref:Multidrug resistance protein MdtN n=1 Tax=Caballeronia telluris TaxID=326475 RepID=A0A158EPV1_9BURK|nr:efflux RND transporter periplasmic adaptor subunit [Caballeronia telluris]SAL09526.1 multidrug resistance protein MdtN [Caballeronia telluris]
MRNNRLSLVISLMALAMPTAWADDATVAVTTAAVHRDAIAQPVRAYGVVAASAANLTTINLPYVARIVQMRVQPGQTVSRGTPLFVVEADPAAALAATQAKSAATLADGELARTQSLYDKSLATASQLAAAKKAALDAHQAFAAQEKTGVANGNKPIAAPADGVVLQVQANTGDQVQAGAPILQLVASGTGNDKRGNVTLGVDPADAAAIHPGDNVTLRGLSTALANNAVQGRVVLVGASIDPQTQLVNVGANVPLGSTAFIPGTRVAADIATSNGTHWIVPRTAVLKDDKSAYVFQVTPAKKARRVNVSMKTEDGARYGVEGPLDASQPLVVTGNYELKDGMTVRPAGGAVK